MSMSNQQKKYFTPEEIVEIYDLHRKGLAPFQISQKIGRWESVTHKVVTSLERRLSGEKVKLTVGGSNYLKAIEIIKEKYPDLVVPKRKAGAKLGDVKRVKTPEEIMQTYLLKKEGWNLYEIGEKLGLTPSEIYCTLNSLRRHMAIIREQKPGQRQLFIYKEATKTGSIRTTRAH